MKDILELFLTFAKIGLFTFGGGYAMISIIENICVEKKKWITHEEMMNITIVAESTPGPVAVNCATFVGFKKKGFAGALAATFGVIIPSFVVIYLIAMFLNHFLEITWIANAFKGIKIAVGILIFDAGLKMLKKMKKQKFMLIVFICSTLLMIFITVLAWNFSSISMMLIAGAVSMVVFLIESRKAGEKK
ncbi:MAG: chromate transporter [Lachnospiraceae bacterium]|nr:chromate transporter [Lachnospiraceae bacterium]